MSKTIDNTQRRNGGGRAENARKGGRKPRRSPEERAEQAKRLHEELTAQVEALKDSEAWMRFLAFARSFHSYSLNNVLLILAQRPGATKVAGFRQWQAKGRQVRKGERAIKILGYSTKNVTETDEETGEEQEKMLRRFPILSVFDISQTDPIEGVDQAEHPARRLTGDDPAGIYEAMAAHMSDQGWNVAREPIAGEASGYTLPTERRIVVDEHLAPAQAAKTMLHEAAHAIFHADLDAGEYVAHRGVCECEAESVAYVLAGLAGLDTSAYSVGYVATWTDGDIEQVRARAANVLRAVSTLADALPETGTEDVSDPAA